MVYRVAVSGITGFIGGQVTLDLLSKGYFVHGTLRRNTPSKLAHLASHPNFANLTVFEADLVTPGSFDSAVAGCTHAVHIASPFASDVANPRAELVEPAVNGTLNFLRACRDAGVPKVVLTSSLAAVADGGVPGKVFDEADWNTHSTERFLPYYYSKAEAERAAWRFVEEEAPGITLVVINPVIVFGPSLIPGLNESANILRSVIEGEMRGIPDLAFPLVDVRDVAAAHVAAMESDSASGRYICCSDGPPVHLREIVRICQKKGFKPPTRDLTATWITAFMRLLSPVVPGGDTGQYMKNHLGRPIVPTNNKIKADLGIEFRDPKQYIEETIDSMIKWGHVALASA